MEKVVRSTIVSLGGSGMQLRLVVDTTESELRLSQKPLRAAYHVNAIDTAAPCDTGNRTSYRQALTVAGVSGPRRRLVRGRAYPG